MSQFGQTATLCCPAKKLLAISQHFTYIKYNNNNNLSPHYKTYSKNTATVFGVCQGKEGEDDENMRKIGSM